MPRVQGNEERTGPGAGRPGGEESNTSDSAQVRGDGAPNWRWGTETKQQESSPKRLELNGQEEQATGPERGTARIGHAPSCRCISSVVSLYDVRVNKSALKRACDANGCVSAAARASMFTSNAPRRRFSLSRSRRARGLTRTDDRCLVHEAKKPAVGTGERG
eukprot:714621-Pleurochrysis_carterae.AAC.1